VFLENGFHATTLEQIAAAAGVTKGAVYSNFAGKTDLFLAVSSARMEQRLEGYARVRASATGLDALLGEFVRIMLSHDPDGRWASVLAEAWAVAAASDPRFRRALIEQSTRGNGVIMRAVAELAERAGVEFILPIEKMNTLCTALVRGMLLQRLLDPATVTRQRIEESLIAVIHSMARPRATTQRRDHDQQLAPRSGGRAASRRGAHRPR
jgi:AcrR family transcriptional regulator